MSGKWIALFVFVGCYALFVVFPRHRSWVACGGGFLLAVTGVLGWRQALCEHINWNVIGLFLGTLILAELFMVSRVPAVLAEWLVGRSPSARGAMLALCALSGGISIFVENVAVVLLVAPVALSLAKKLEIHPAGLLIGIAISSNLQGTATMIGDPPSMILAGYLKMGFLDFFVYQGRAGIFWVVEAGAVASLCTLAWLFRHYRKPVALIPVETARSWVPCVFLAILVIGLSLATLMDPNFSWFAGAFSLSVAAAALLWLHTRARWVPVADFLRRLDWDTTFFLMGVFVLVGGLSHSGWLNRLADSLAARLGGSRFAAFAVVLALSVGVSGFVDNVPFLLAMIPVVEDVSVTIGAPGLLLPFALLVGTCLGGNLTPVGASANVVAIGLLRKQGLTVGFRDFFAIGVPFTMAAVSAAAGLLWVLWSS